MIIEKEVIINGQKYIVCSSGEILSTSNIGRGEIRKPLKQRLNEDGYKVVTVGINGLRKSKRVHRIIAETFISNPENLPEVDHIDFDRKNNDISNLRWIDSIENKKRTPFELRSITHSGEMNGRAKLTVEDVINIRKLYKSGKTQNEIAKIYKRGWSTIHNIIMENTWKGIN